jgi:tRNA-2-methylthio-N6-dimethylallyladenosine synthase
MNRKYTFSRYQEIVQAIRSFSDDLFLSTDLLVGFPGETEEDFQQTLEAVKTIRFDDAYTFKFSKRKFTKASEMDGVLPEDTLSDRLARIIDLQRSINLDITRQQVGKVVEVLVEEPSQYSPEEFLCRTASGRYVLVPAAGKKMGQLVKVRLTGVRGVTLVGE